MANEQDDNMNFRISGKAKKAFYRACKRNKETNPTAVARKLMDQYTAGKITFETKQEN